MKHGARFWVEILCVASAWLQFTIYTCGKCCSFVNVSIPYNLCRCCIRAKVRNTAKQTVANILGIV